jgi:hypothetical protein
MSSERGAELIARAAADREVSADLLTALLDLEREIPEANAWGAKTLLARRVAEILDEASRREGV